MASKPADPHVAAVQVLHTDDLEVPDPRKWNLQRRRLIVALISVLTCISPMSSSMVAPALEDIRRDLHITNSFTKQLVLSIYLLLFGIFPVVIAPLSEHFGRVPVMHVGNLIFLIFNTACGVARTPAQMLACRALSGLGGGAPMAIGAAMIGDLFVAEERGTAMALYNLMPILGPALGAIMGAAVTEFLTWRWIFYIASIVEGVVFVLSLVTLSETYVPVLRRRIQQRTEDALVEPLSLRARTILKDLGQALLRPLRMLCTHGVIQLLAIYVALLYGTMYLVVSTFPTLWMVKYHQSVLVSGLNFIALGLGYVLGTHLCGLTVDRIYSHLKRRNSNIGLPEHRLPLAIFSFLLVPTGLVIYGWTAQYQVHWIAPDLGATIFSMGVIIALQCTANYLIDAYPEHAASALGAVTLLRGIAGFGLPLFGPSMYARMGYGWGNTLLAAIAFFTGITAPLALWIFGAAMRERIKINL